MTNLPVVDGTSEVIPTKLTNMSLGGLYSAGNVNNVYRVPSVTLSMTTLYDNVTILPILHAFSV